MSSHPDLLAKYGARWHLWKSKVAKIALVGARIHLQKGQRDNFTRGLKSFATQTFGVPFIVKSPLTSGFFQKIASTHHANLMMLAWGLLKWKMARKKTLIKTILTKFERSWPPTRQNVVTVVDVTKYLSREAMETAVILTNSRFFERQKSTGLLSPQSLQKNH